MLTIGSLAKRTGVGIQTLRYYERRTLLSPSQRTAAGYRQYPESEVQRIEFINTETIDRSNQSLFLPRDGHFSGHGAMTMAQLVVEHLNRAPVSAPTR